MDHLVFVQVHHDHMINKISIAPSAARCFRIRDRPEGSWFGYLAAHRHRPEHTLLAKGKGQNAIDLRPLNVIGRRAFAISFNPDPPASHRSSFHYSHSNKYLASFCIIHQPSAEQAIRNHVRSQGYQFYRQILWSPLFPLPYARSRWAMSTRIRDPSTCPPKKGTGRSTYPKEP
jgi:hypothetical protein